MSGTDILALQPPTTALLAILGTATPALQSMFTVSQVSLGTDLPAYLPVDHPPVATTVGCGMVSHVLNATPHVEDITASAVTLGTETVVSRKIQAAVEQDVAESSFPTPHQLHIHIQLLFLLLHLA